MNLKSFYCIAAASLTCRIQAQNLLNNPGFESGDFSGWTISATADVGVNADGVPLFGSTVSDNQVNVRSGNFAAWANLRSEDFTSVANRTFALSQGLTLAPSSAYKIGFWFSTGTDLRPLGFSGGVFVNGRGLPNLWDGVAVILHPEVPHFFGGTKSTNFTHIESVYRTGPAPEQLSISFQMMGVPAPHGYSFDDFSVELIPEPSIGWLAGLGLVLLTVIGHRRSSAPRRFESDSNANARGEINQQSIDGGP